MVYRSFFDCLGSGRTAVISVGVSSFWMQLLIRLRSDAYNLTHNIHLALLLCCLTCICRSNCQYRNVYQNINWELKFSYRKQYLHVYASRLNQNGLVIMKDQLNGGCCQYITEPITRILAGKLVSLGQPSETCSWKRLIISCNSFQKKIEIFHEKEVHMAQLDSTDWIC
jgi:hypothetical protein